MIIAFMILDSFKFSLFEYFPDRSRINEVIDFIESLDSLEGDFQKDDIHFHLSKFTEKLAYCLVYSDEEFDPILRERLPQLSNMVMKGDKVSLRQLLQSQMVQQLAFIS